MSTTTPDPITEHANSSDHRESVLRAGAVGCFYCRSIYDPGEILAWVDDDEFLGAMHRQWFG